MTTYKEMSEWVLVGELINEGLELPFEKAFEHFVTLIKLDPKVIHSPTVQKWIIDNQRAILKLEKERGRKWKD